MTVFLAHGCIPQDREFHARGTVAAPPESEDAFELDLGEALEQARARLVPDYLELCRQLAAESGARLAHSPSAATNISDLLTMMAWAAVVKDLAARPQRYGLRCDDPWLFRHLLTLPGVSSTAPPPLPHLRLALRGWAARLLYTAKALRAWWRASPPGVERGGAWLLSYPHPAHEAKRDAYFGDLPRHVPCRRVLHVDGDAVAALPSLASWARPWWVMLLPFARWRPSARWRGHWLVRRAAALEGSTAQAAAIRWQILCQGRWLERTRPRAVAWPWENHGWERALVAQARSVGCRSVGYQHTVIGRTEFNHHAVIDPVALPDQILCAGPISLRHLTAWGHSPDRLSLGGALRHQEVSAPSLDPSGPVFFALPGDRMVARQMVRAAVALGRPVLVRPHPAYDVEVPETNLVHRADQPFSRQSGLAAIVYAATTVGLEAVVAGLPTIRFIPGGCIVLDILPNNISLPAARADTLAVAIAQAAVPPRVSRDDLFAPVEYDRWRSALLEIPAP